MAKKRRVKRRRTLSSPGLSKRRAPRRRKRGLSEGLSALTNGTVGTGIKSGISGFVGGMAGSFVNSIIPSNSPIAELALSLGLTVGASFMGMPNTGAGVMGAYAQRVHDRMRGRTMQEEADYANEQALNEMPVFLDEQGNEMYLSEEDGNFYYMDEGGNFYLAGAPELLAQAPELLADRMTPGYVPNSYTN